ncbi:MAG: hypothetical protein ACYDDZ_11060 [Acidimicrobiales bacterium]
MSTSDGAGILEALSRAQSAVGLARSRLNEAIAARDSLVVDAVDLHQISWRHVAAATGIHVSAVHRILVNAGVGP